MPKRSYNRRAPEQIIADLEAKVAVQKKKIAAKSMANDPVLREIPGLKKRLSKFARLALDGGRKDTGNAALAFVTSLERMAK